MKLSIVVPCYNEAKNIPLLLNKFAETIKREDVEVVLVDNGSSDETPQILEKLLPNYSFARSIRIEKNQGYGYGVIQGLKACYGKFLGWTHADLQTDPADLIKALEIIEKYDSKNIFVKGNRRNRPIFDQFFTLGMSVFETLYLRARLYDINAQPNVFSREFFESWVNPPYDFSLDLYALYMAQQQKIHIERFDVIFPERVYGESHWNTGMHAKIKFIKRTLEFSKKLKKEGIR